MQTLVSGLVNLGLSPKIFYALLISLMCVGYLGHLNHTDLIRIKKFCKCANYATH